MSQGTIYRSRQENYFLCRVQSDLGLETALILFAPVVPRGSIGSLLPRLYIPCTVLDAPHVILMSELVALPMSDVGEPIGSAKAARDEMVSAIDFLVTGF